MPPRVISDETTEYRVHRCIPVFDWGSRGAWTSARSTMDRQTSGRMAPDYDGESNRLRGKEIPHRRLFLPPGYRRGSLALRALPN